MQKPELIVEVDVSEGYDFGKETLDLVSENQWVAHEYPVVYLLNSGEEKSIAYVGETANTRTRLETHIREKKKKNEEYNKVTIIGSEKFNRSVTLDFEARLIQCLQAEGTYEVRNGNYGHLLTSYYQHDLYRQSFRQTWQKLIDRKIVSKNLEEVENTNLFKYSPYKALNADQHQSVIEIIDHINSGKPGAIFLSGSAGTGKTIIATYLIKLLVSGINDDEEPIGPDAKREYDVVKAFRETYPNPKIALVIAMTSLRETLKEVFRQVPGLSAAMVIGPSAAAKKEYDLLLVDEAHRLRRDVNLTNTKAFRDTNALLGLGKDGTELDWILKQSKHQVLFYDAKQTVRPSDIPTQRFTRILQRKDTLKLVLRSQMRSLGGNDYIDFVDHLLDGRHEKLKDIHLPSGFELLHFDSFRDLHTQLVGKERAYGLCRMMAGYAWKWLSKKDKNAYDIELEGLRFQWNMQLANWINSPNAAREIGCIHTTQGYDLNYAAVIFGKEVAYDPETRQIVVRKEHYYDFNGWRGIRDPEDLRQYIINIYRTSLYRGMRGVYLYACDPALRAYLRQHIQNYIPDFPFRKIRFEDVRPYVNAVPVFNLEAAAGGFSDLQQPEQLTWIELPASFTPRKGYFVCRVTGDSMLPLIPNGAWCLFTPDTGGTRHGKTVLVQHYAIQDDLGSGYTVKDYHSAKVQTEEGWRHQTITLKPKNPAFEPIVLKDDELEALKVVGVFHSVLD